MAAGGCGGGGENPLRKMAEAFEGLASSLNSQSDLDEASLEVGRFSHACSLVSPLFRCLGIAFKFAELDYVAKAVSSLLLMVGALEMSILLMVDDLVEASKTFLTLPLMMDKDIEVNCVKKAGSHTRNLLRVKRGLDMVKVLFEQILVLEGNSLKDPASTAYAQVFAPYHGWAIRKAVAAGMYALPTKIQLLKKLNEEESSAKALMQNYVSASGPVIMYIDKLFITRQLGTDW